MKTPTLYRSQRSLVIVFLLLLGACTSSTSTQQQVQREPTSAADWLQLAQTAAPVERASYELKAAQLLQQQGQAKAAEDVLQSLASEQLPATAVGDYLGLKATLLEQQQGSKAAIQWLNSPEQRLLLRSATPQQQAVALTVLAELQDQSGLYAQAMNTRLQISKLLGSGTALADNQEAIWQSLIQTPTSSLQRELEASADMDQELRGWYELAVIANSLEGDIDQQVAAVEQWRRRWPSHPAALTAPAEIDLLMLLSASKPSQIAVFLPMQGPLKDAGHALRDGMLKAYFDGRSRGAQSSPLVFYDTEVYLDMAALYRRAVDNGAELIIGPLKKDRVDALLKASNGLVPILALNYAATELEAGDNFYQFGLSNEDEAVAAAERAWHEGYNRALVIQSSDSQSTRGAKAFEEAWDEREGITVAVIDVGTDREASDRIKQGLHIDLSQQRARALESATGTSLQYNPRRRQDIDIVYLPVSAQQARSIKPLLAFHFAQDLPVYANSRVYRGKPDPRGDTDLNGVLFTDTPWSLGNSSGQQTIENYIERGGAPSKNLYAMGIDAYQFAPRLPQLLFTPSLTYRGMTGTLTLSAQGIVLRRPGWAVFRNGIAEPIDEDPMEYQDESMDAKTAESLSREPSPNTNNRPTI
jgi:outer membrane PBP1 activator LpoA protein